MFANFDFYTNQFLGSMIPKDDFAAAALRASQFLEYYTRGKVKENADMEAVKMATCALAEEYYTVLAAQRLAQQTATEGDIESQTVGSYSVKYRSKAETAQALAAVSRVKLAEIVLGLVLIPVLFYSYNGMFGKSPDWLNIAIFYISAALVFLFEWWVFKRDRLRCKSSRLTFAVICLIGVLFVVFTFAPPKIPLFQDSLTGTYGIVS